MKVALKYGIGRKREKTSLNLEPSLDTAVLSSQLERTVGHVIGDFTNGDSYDNATKQKA